MRQTGVKYTGEVQVIGHRWKQTQGQEVQEVKKKKTRKQNTKSSRSSQKVYFKSCNAR